MRYFRAREQFSHRNPQFVLRLVLQKPRLARSSKCHKRCNLILRNLAEREGFRPSSLSRTTVSKCEFSRCAIMSTRKVSPGARNRLYLVSFSTWGLVRCRRLDLEEPAQLSVIQNLAQFALSMLWRFPDLDDAIGVNVAQCLHNTRRPANLHQICHEVRPNPKWSGPALDDA